MGRKFSLLTTTALTTSTALMTGAAAADLRMPVKAVPVNPPFSWNGCYIGGNVGGASVRIDQRVIVDGVGEFDTDWRRTGITGGGQVGCNFQSSPNWVWGLEGDINLVDAHRRRTFDFTVGGQDVVGTHATKLHWLATLRGRLGPTWGRTFAYVTGGLAAGDIRSSATLVAETGDTFAGSKSDTRFGWTVGVGIEHALSAKVSAKLEYLHFDLGRERYNVNVVTGVPGTVIRASSQVSGDIVRLGLNWRWN